MCIAVPYLCWFLLSIAATYLPEGPLRTTEGLQRAAQELEAVYALHSDSELKERGLPIAIEMKEMYQRTKDTEEAPRRKLPSGEFAYTERAPLFAKAFFVTCLLRLQDDPGKYDWIHDNDCIVLKDLAPDNPRALYLYASAHIRRGIADKSSRTLEEIYPIINALNDAIAIIESGKPIVPILPYRNVVDKYDIYLERGLCYSILGRIQQAENDLAIATKLGNKQAGLFEAMALLLLHSPADRKIDDALLNYEQKRLKSLKSSLADHNYQHAINLFHGPGTFINEDQRRSGLYNLSPHEELEWYTGAGDAYLALGHYNYSISIYSQALAKYPDSHTLSAKLAQAEQLQKAREKEQFDALLRLLYIAGASLVFFSLLYIARRPLTNFLFAVARMIKSYLEYGASERQARAFARLEERRQQQEIEQIRARDRLEKRRLARLRKLPARQVNAEQSRYPHPSYRLSAWAWAMFWLLVALPFALMTGRILWHFFAFSWDGIPEGLADAQRTLSAWRPMGVDALICMPLFGFVGFKLHGRYSLPKPERPRIRPMYATAKVCFFILSLVTMYYSLTRISHHVDNIVETGIIKEPEETRKGEEELHNTILAAVTSSAAKRNFDKEISNALDRGDIAHAGVYIDLADWLKISVSPHIRARYQQTQRFWAKAIRSVEDCVSGAVLRNTENLTQIVCIVGSELFVSPIADGIDIVKQVIIHPLTGQETDFFIAGGAALSRFFDRRARLFKHADTAIRLQRVASKGGPTAAIIAARHASTVNDLRFAGRIANRFEGNTAGVLHLLGKRAFGMFKHYRIAKIVQLIMGGWAGLWALAMTALLSCLFSSVRSRVFRIVTLRFLRRYDERRIAHRQTAGV